MNTHKLSDMIGGWFVGGFQPTVHFTENFEVGVKRYKPGDREEYHVHKVAKEITLIVSGKVEMNGQSFGEGDIISIDPGEGTDFRAITEVVDVVVKWPSILGDKYPR